MSLIKTINTVSSNLSFAPIERGVLIEGCTLEDKKVIVEQVNGEEVMFLEGILQRADTLNQNGRIYPRDILEKELRNYQKLIRERRALGALDHTDNSIIELKTASHVIVEAEMDNKGIIRGRLEILNHTTNGKELKGLIKQNITVGISSRGVGSTQSDSNGYQVVQEDFQLVCWDVVSEPSTPGAFVYLTEGIDEYLNKVFTKSDRIDRIANDILSWGK